MLTNLKKIYSLAKPYGRRRLVVVGAVTVLQGIVATMGVASIFPFLAIATDTRGARESDFGQTLLSYLPKISDQTLLLIAGSGAVAMLLLANGIHLLTVYVTARYSRGFGLWLRVRLLKKIMSREYSYFLQSSSGVIIKKVNNDTTNLIGQVLMPLFQIFAGTLNVLLLACALLWYSPWAALSSSMVLLGAYLLIYKLLTHHRQRFSEVMLMTSRRSNRLVHQLLSAIKPIKVHGVEEEFIRGFETIAAKAADCLAKQGVIQIAPKNLVEPVALGILIAIVTMYSYRGESLSDILPTIGLMAMAAYRLLPNIQSIYASATMYSSNLHALSEVYDEFGDSSVPGFRNVSPIKRLGRLNFSREIELRELSFRYPSSQSNIIDTLNLSIPAFSSLAIVGTTGCGKSTLVDLILGLHLPTSGRILVDGVELTIGNRRPWLNTIGYVPQDIVLMDDTVAANIALGRKESEIDWEQMRQCCEAAQILDFIEKSLSNQWKTEVGERGVRLSGGQRQRVGIARALYHKPDLLILDEATSALDVETESGVMESIKALRGKITMIIITHRKSTIWWCHKVFDMSDKNATIVEAAT